MEDNAPYHFVGIGGIGMSSLAQILLDRKSRVSGTDQKVTPLVAQLQAAGAREQPFPGAQVVYSSAIPPNHPERAQAQGKAIHRSEALKALMEGYKPLLVAGTHGKTTVTALLAWVLLEAGLDPAFAIGGILRQLHRNGRHGSGPYFVAEADESDGSHVIYEPFASIVTGAEPEHLDHYSSDLAFRESFEVYLSKSRQLFWCADDPYLAAMHPKGIAYGFDDRAQLRASEFCIDGFEIHFTAHFQGCSYRKIRVPLIGRHNALNALAVFGLALSLDVSEEQIRAAFESFPGVVRRCEPKGSVREALVLDDYAHHPTELRATLEALRAAVGNRRLWAVVQPHRYTRTRDCLELYAGSCEPADELVVTDIYQAREESVEGLTAELVAAKTAHRCVRVLPRDGLVAALAREIRPHDVVVFMGAGDITQASTELASLLEKEPPRRYRVALLCGGHYTEHAISLTSAHHVGEWLQDDLYEVERIVVNGAFPPESYARVAETEVLFPVFHGPKGEDGLYAALGDLLDKPVVGCDFRSSCVAMDKALTKRIVQSHGIPTLPFVELLRDAPAITLDYPLMVKPVSLGSSVGISRVESAEELPEALEKAFACDERVILEPAVKGRELEFAVLDGKAAPPGEILTGGAVYSAERKYGAGSMPTDVNPLIPEAVLSQGLRYAEAAYRALRCSGWARVDFFLCDETQWWLNEINPIPGCTRTSLFPLIWQREGLSCAKLMDRLICHALKRKRDSRRWERESP